MQLFKQPNPACSASHMTNPVNCDFELRHLLFSHPPLAHGNHIICIQRMHWWTIIQCKWSFAHCTVMDCRLCGICTKHTLHAVHCTWVSDHAWRPLQNYIFVDGHVYRNMNFVYLSVSEHIANTAISHSYTYFTKKSWNILRSCKNFLVFETFVQLCLLETATFYSYAVRIEIVCVVM